MARPTEPVTSLAILSGVLGGVLHGLTAAMSAISSVLTTPGSQAALLQETQQVPLSSTAVEAPAPMKNNEPVAKLAAHQPPMVETDDYLTNRQLRPRQLRKGYCHWHTLREERR